MPNQNNNGDGTFDFGTHLNNYPFNVGSHQNDNSAITLVCSINEADLLCPNFSITPIISCASDNDIIEDSNKSIYFQQLIFSRTSYETEEKVLKTEGFKEFVVNSIQRYRHRFTTIMQDEEYKRIQKLKLFGKLVINNYVNQSAYIINRLKVEPIGNKNNAEYDVEISFLVENEEVTTEACCNPPITKEYNLTNCGGGAGGDDNVFSIPPNRCEDFAVTLTDVDNGDGTHTLSHDYVGNGGVFWFQDGNLVAQGSVSYTANKPGYYCVKVVDRSCQAESCVTIEDECVGRLEITIKECVVVFNIFEVPDSNTWTLNVVKVGGGYDETFTGTGEGAQTLNLPEGRYTASFVPKENCPETVFPFIVFECPEECVDVVDQMTFDCTYDEETDSFSPVFTYPETVVFEIQPTYSYSVNGASDFGDYNGGGVTGLGAGFIVEFKIQGCKPVKLFTYCIKDCDTIVLNNPSTIDVNVVGTTTVEIDGCIPLCDKPKDGNGNDCPDPIKLEGSSNVINVRNNVFGVSGVYFHSGNYIHWQTLGDTFVQGGGGDFVNQSCVWGASYPDIQNCSRLNKTGIWVDDPDADKVVFAICATIDKDGYYAFGAGADNQAEFKIDGQTLIHIENNGGTNENQQLAFKRWYVVDVYLEKGKHLIQINGHNVDPGSAESVGFELYNATTSQLMQLTTEQEVDSMVVAHSRMIDNLNLIFNVPGGLSCPEGTTPSFIGCIPICDCDENYIPIEKKSMIYLTDVKSSISSLTMQAGRITSLKKDGVELIQSPFSMVYTSNVGIGGIAYNPSIAKSINDLMNSLNETFLIAEMPSATDFNKVANNDMAKILKLTFNDNVKWEMKFTTYAMGANVEWVLTNDSQKLQNSTGFIMTNRLPSYLYIDFSGSGTDFTPYIAS